MATNKKIGIELLEDDLIFKINNAAQIKEITFDMLDPSLRAIIESKKVDDTLDLTSIYQAIDTLTKNKADKSELDGYFKKDTDKVTGTMVDDSLLDTIAQTAYKNVSKKLNSVYRQLADSITMNDLGADVTAQFDTIKQSISNLSSKIITASDIQDINDRINNLDSTISNINTVAQNAETTAQSAINGQTPINNSITALSSRLTNLENTAMIENTSVLIEAQLPATTREQLQTMASQIALLQNPTGSAETDKAVSATMAPVATNDLQADAIKADSGTENFYYIDTDEGSILYYSKTLVHSSAFNEGTDSSSDSSTSTEGGSSAGDTSSEESTPATVSDEDTNDSSAGSSSESSSSTSADTTTETDSSTDSSEKTDGSTDTSESSGTATKTYTWTSETLATTGIGFILDNKYGRIFYNTHLVGGYPYILTFDINLLANESQSVETTQWFTNCLANRPLTYIRPDTEKDEYIPATLYVTTAIRSDGFTVTNNTDETISIKVIVKGVCR